MAERLESFEFPPGGRRSGSRFDRYMDGGIYRLKYGEDVAGTSSDIQLRTVARKLGLKLHIHKEPDGLVVQAYRPDGRELRSVA